MKLLITGAWTEAKNHIKELEDLGHEVYYLQYEKDELPCSYEKIEGVICNGLFLYHRIEKFINLKYIQLTSAGYDRIPMNFIHMHNIKIFNARGVYSIPMAEYALCGVLQLYKQSNYFYINQINHEWKKNRELFELNGKNVCIIGCGSVGNECAKRFSAMGCNILGIDTKPYQNELYVKMDRLLNVRKFLLVSDIVILTIPLTTETRLLINADLLKIMKKNSVIVNISRGEIVDTVSLVKFLQKNLLGAVLDVFDSEPLAKTSELWDLSNVIITPHNSFVGDRTEERLHRVILKNLFEFI